MSKDKNVTGATSHLTQMLDVWQPIETIPYDRKVLVQRKSGGFDEIQWIGHRHSFCCKSCNSDTMFNETDIDWYDGWQETSCEKIDAIFHSTCRDI